jgi:hypothetical protein
LEGLFQVIAEEDLIVAIIEGELVAKESEPFVVEEPFATK